MEEPESKERFHIQLQEGFKKDHVPIQSLRRQTALSVPWQKLPWPPLYSLCCEFFCHIPMIELCSFFSKPSFLMRASQREAVYWYSFNSLAQLYMLSLNVRAAVVGHRRFPRYQEKETRDHLWKCSNSATLVPKWKPQANIPVFQKKNWVFELNLCNLTSFTTRKGIPACSLLNIRVHPILSTQKVFIKVLTHAHKSHFGSDTVHFSTWTITFLFTPFANLSGEILLVDACNWENFKKHPALPRWQREHNTTNHCNM